MAPNAATGTPARHSFSARYSALSRPAARRLQSSPDTETTCVIEMWCLSRTDDLAI